MYVRALTSRVLYRVVSSRYNNLRGSGFGTEICQTHEEGGGGAGSFSHKPHIHGLFSSSNQTI